MNKRLRNRGNRHIAVQDLFIADIFPVQFAIGVCVFGNRVPCKSRPPKTPRDREYVSSSACICASVMAVELLPTGPAAAAASPPNLNLLLKQVLHTC